MQRIINTNSNLHKLKIIRNPNCTLCLDNKIDDIEHALIECPWTKYKLQTILTNLDPDQIWAKSICPTKLLFGVYNKSVNNLILIVKHYLLKVRSGKYTFSLKNLKREIYLRIQSDRQFSKVINFESKWSAHTSLVIESVQYSINSH